MTRICHNPVHVGSALGDYHDLYHCADCKCDLPDDPPVRPWFIPRWCDPCYNKREAGYLASQSRKGLSPRSEWEIRWDEGDDPICPPLYRDTDTRNQGFNRPAWAKAERWKFGHQGLLLYGSSRQSKSRIMFLLLKREYLYSHRSVRVLYGANLRDLAKAASRDGQESRIVSDLTRPSILAFDDPFLAGTADERVTTFLLSVIDARVRERLPIIVTSQIGDAETAESAGRFSNATVSDRERIAAIFSRIKEVCAYVICDPAPNPSFN